MDNKEIWKYFVIGIKGLLSGIGTQIISLICFGILGAFLGVALSMNNVTGGMAGGLGMIIAGLAIIFFITVWGAISHKAWGWD